MVVSSFMAQRAQSTTDVLSFISIHNTQIRHQVARHAWLEFGDYQNEVALCIIEKGHKFDPLRGSFSNFIFGHVEKRLRWIFDDALSHSNSIDDDSDRGLLFRARAESVVAVRSEEDQILAIRVSEVVPGAVDLAMIADAISGLSAEDASQKMKISKRRVNQLLVQAKEEAKQQYSLFHFIGDAT